MIIGRIRAVLGRCYCGGRNIRWRYHTPTGCSATRSGLERAQDEYRKLEKG